MKKITYAIAVLAAAALSASCAKEEFAPVNNTSEELADGRHMMVFSTAITKTTIEGGTPAWEAGDSVKIFWVETGEDGTAAVMETKAAVNPDDGTISAAVGTARDYYYAVYPQWATSSLVVTEDQPDSLTVTVRSTSGDGLWNSAHYCAALTDESSACFNFKNISCAVKFTVTDPSVTRVSFSTPDDDMTASKVRFSFNGEDPCDDPNYVSPQYVSTVTIPGPGTYYAPIVYNAEWLGGFIVTEWAGEDLANIAVTENPVYFGRSNVFNIGVVEEHSSEMGGDLFIKPAACGDGSGSDWDNAAGVDRLVSILDSPSGYIYIQNRNIYLAEGSYDMTVNGENLENIYKFPASFHIIGSFPASATGTDITGSDVDAHPSIFYTSSNCANARTFFFKGQLGTVVFDSVQFGPYDATVSARGYATYVNADVQFSAEGSLTYQNCRFKGLKGEIYGALDFNNEAGHFNVIGCTFDGNESTKPDYGSPCLYLENGTLNIEGCTFKNNKALIAGFGGAMGFAAGTANIKDCMFVGNSAATYGGALGVGATNNSTIFNSGNVVVNVTGCTFDSNIAAYGGAINHAYGTLNLDNSNFTKNVATSKTPSSNSVNVGGGAISTFYASKGALFTGSYPTKGTGATLLKDCTFTENHCYGRGGAIHHLSTGSFVIDGCSFIGNYTDTRGNGGGAIFHGGSNGCCDLYVSNSLFDANESKVATTNAVAAIATKSGSTIFLSGCAFKNHKTPATGTCCVGAIGSCTGIYMFGCSFLDNGTGTAAFDSFGYPAGIFNCSFAETTSTYTNGIVNARTTTYGKCTLMGNIITGAASSMDSVKGTGADSKGFNIFSTAASAGGNDLAGKSASDVFPSMSLMGTTIQTFDAVTTMLPSNTDVAAVKAAIQTANETFFNWLVDINAFDSMTASWRPGSYQK